MKCPHCQADNPEHALKCVKCGGPLSAAAQAPVEDEFELQPEAPKAPERDFMQGPPRIDTESMDKEAASEPDVPAPGKKPKKKIPELPKDYKRESQLLLAAMGGLLVFSMLLSFFDVSWLIGWGLPPLAGGVFAMLAMLEALKVVQYHNAGDYEGSNEASTAARWYIRTGIFVAIVSLVVLIALKIVLLIFGKIASVMAPKTDVPN